MFAFTLQPLLDHRRSVEEAARARWAACDRAYRAAVHELRASETLIGRLYAAPHAVGRLHGCAAAIDRQRRAVVRFRHACQQAQRDCAAAAVALKSVEQLRSRRYAAYLDEQRCRDDRELDDANALRAPARRTRRLGTDM